MFKTNHHLLNQFSQEKKEKKKVKYRTWPALTYSLAHSRGGVHLITIVTLTFVASFKIYTYLTTYTRVEALIDICGETIIVSVPVEEHSHKDSFLGPMIISTKFIFWLHLNSTSGYSYHHRSFDQWAGVLACSHTRSQSSGRGRCASSLRYWAGIRSYLKTKRWMAASHAWNINAAHSQEMHGYDMLRFTGINNPESFHMMNIPQGKTMSLNQV